MHEVNIIIAMLLFITWLAMGVFAVILRDPENLRRLAAWASGKASYREHVIAERERGRELGEDVRRRMLADFGIEDLVRE